MRMNERLPRGRVVDVRIVDIVRGMRGNVDRDGCQIVGVGHARRERRQRESPVDM